MDIKKLILVAILLQVSTSFAEKITGHKTKIVVRGSADYWKYKSKDGARLYRVCTHEGTKFMHIMSTGSYVIQNKKTGENATYVNYGKNSDGDIINRIQGELRDTLPAYFVMSKNFGIKYSYSYDPTIIDEVDEGFYFFGTYDENGKSVVYCIKK